MKRQRTLLVLFATVGVLVGAFWVYQMRSGSEAEPAPRSPAASASTTNAARTSLAKTTPAADKGAPATKSVTNAAPKAAIPVPAAKSRQTTNVATVVPVKGKPSGTNVLATTKPIGTNAVTTLTFTDRVRQLADSRGFYPALGLVFVGIILLLVALRSRQKPSGAAAAVSTTSAARKPTARPASHCNVLYAAGESQKLWQFSARNGAFVLTREHSPSAGQKLPASVVSKDWRALWQRKLNIAWLPPESVFLRVGQFPMSSFDETLAMVELQLEKLSPIPVAQVVWSIQTMPHPEPNLQTVVVLIVARSVVEEFLGRLESQGFMADRLEVRLLDELLVTPHEGDGAWVYAGTTDGGMTGLVAWWYGGALCNLDLVTLPAQNAAAGLSEQIAQIAWAGELEGWLKSRPTWHLVADEADATAWEAILREAVQQPVEVVPRRKAPDLASLTAARSARDERQANLLPVEFLTRYQQQFVDRLWMRSLGAVLLLYLVGVGIYMVALQYALYRTRAVESAVAELGPAYTNAMQLKARYEVLKDRQDLKFAALDCWKTLAETLPESVTLDGLNFSDGRRLSLNGSASAGEVKQLLEFESAMRKAQSNHQLLFDPAKGDNLNYRANPGASTVTWNFALELKRVEVQ